MQKILKRVGNIIKFEFIMKKVLVVLCVAAVAFAFTSCKKDSSSGTKSSCQCTGTYTLQGIPLSLGPIGVGNITPEQCEVYDWNWAALLPTSQFIQDFDYTCKSE